VPTANDKRRNTQIQFRGNYLARHEVTAAVRWGLMRCRKVQPGSCRSPVGWWTRTIRSPRVSWPMSLGANLWRRSEPAKSLAAGEPPTNPELPIGSHAVRDGADTTAPWDMKAFLKLLVTSATYRQSSRVTPEMKERDSTTCRWLGPWLPHVRRSCPRPAPRRVVCWVKRCSDCRLAATALAWIDCGFWRFID
jgi:hypothetical protein